MLRSYPPRRAGRLHEAKFGGWRIQLYKDGSFVRLYNKSRYDCVQRFGELCSALAAVSARYCIIDGEVTAFDPLGPLDFHALHFRTADDEDIAVPYAGPRGTSRAARDSADISTAVVTTAEIGGRGDAPQPVEVKAFPFCI